MFCSESCKHGVNATSSGRILGPKKSAAPIEQHSTKMVEQQQHQFHQQQQQLRFAPQQPCCNMFCDAQPPAELWMQNCKSAPQRMGTCIVTEGSEGLSIDCNVPIPSSFNLDGYNPQLLSFLPTPPGSNEDNSNQSNVCNPMTATTAVAAVDNSVDQRPKPPVKQCRKKTQQQSQSAASEYPCYPTRYSPPSELSPEVNAAPAVTVMPMPVNQLLAYLSGVMCPPAATAPSPSPYQNLQQAPSCCHIQLHNLLLKQQQQQQPTIAAQPPGLMRFELPCLLTGYTSGQFNPEQPQPTFALQLLPLPDVRSMPSIPLPIPTESLPTPSKQTTETCACQPAPPPPPPPTLSCTNPAAGPRKPILINRKAAPRCNVDAQYSYGRRPPFPLGNGNGNGCRNLNRNGNSNNGNGNSCISPLWHCSGCSHCCYHPCEHH